MYRKVNESQTLLINTQSKELIKQNKRVIKFGFGQSPFLPPPDVLKALKDAVYHKEYSSVQGDFELRKRMAKFHFNHNGLKVNPNNILLAPGSKILLFNILLAFEKADVFIPTPAWVSYAPQVELTGHHLIPIKTTLGNRWRINGNAILTAAKQKQNIPSIMILNYPGNPDGLTYSQIELEKIAKIARALDILVISDEIYGLLNHQYQHFSIAHFYPEKTITTTGLSKWCGAGGWRFGAAFLYEGIPSSFKQALIGIASETYSCAPTPVQMAAKVAYANYSKTQAYLQKQIEILKIVAHYCTTALKSYGVKVEKPQGGFYLFPDFSELKEQLHARGINTSNTLCERLLAETGVALLPASAFGFSSNYLAARLAYVDFDEPQDEEIFSLDQHGARIIEGIQLIGDWLKLGTQASNI